jgi:glycosyltransferase involved in cell wall biosynthesis
MRIIQIIPELNEGGVERGVVELSRELVVRGMESIVISAGGRLAATIEGDGGRHVRLDVASKNPLTALQRAWSLRKVLAELQPDLIHARSRVPAWLSVLANRSLKIPFVTTVHGFNSVNPYSRVMTYGDRVICVSSAIKNYIKCHYRVPDEKIVVIPRGVDLDAFNPAIIDHAFVDVFRQKYNLQSRFVVSTVGRITQLKDIESFIRAIGLLRERFPETVGLIVGGVHATKRKYFQSLQRLTGYLGLDDCIVFTGSHSKIAEIYFLSDVVVSSSKKPESFGRAAAEALAMNVPVVATAHGGILDIVINGKTGCLFQPGDYRALAQGIEKLRYNRPSGLREFVEQNFTLARMVGQTLSIYLSLAEKAEKRPDFVRHTIHNGE